MVVLLPLLLPRLLIIVLALLALATCSFIAAFRWCGAGLKRHLLGPSHLLKVLKPCGIGLLKRICYSISSWRPPQPH